MKPATSNWTLDVFFNQVVCTLLTTGGVGVCVKESKNAIISHCSTGRIEEFQMVYRYMYRVQKVMYPQRISRAPSANVQRFKMISHAI